MFFSRDFLFFSSLSFLSLPLSLPRSTPPRSTSIYLFWCLTNAKLAHATTTNPAAKPEPIASWPHAVGAPLPPSPPPIP